MVPCRAARVFMCSNLAGVLMSDGIMLYAWVVVIFPLLLPPHGDPTARAVELSIGRYIAQPIDCSSA